MFIILGIILILTALYLLYKKYSIIKGGVLCDAVVINHEKIRDLRGRPSYKFIVKFEYEGKEMEKKTYLKSIMNYKKIGDPCRVYYNENRPDYVIIKNYNLEMFCLLLIILGFISVF